MLAVHMYAVDAQLLVRTTCTVALLLVPEPERHCMMALARPGLVISQGQGHGLLLQRARGIEGDHPCENEVGIDCGVADPALEAAAGQEPERILSLT